MVKSGGMDVTVADDRRYDSGGRRHNLRLSLWQASKRAGSRKNDSLNEEKQFAFQENDSWSGKLMRGLVRLVFGCSIATLLWVVVANLLSLPEIEGIYFPVLLTLFLVMLLGILIPKPWVCAFVNLLQKDKRILIVGVMVAFLLSVGARFAFLAFEYQPYRNDPVSFFNIAQTLVERGSLGGYDNYVIFAPYTMLYDVMLSWSMRVFGANLFAVIILNTALDLLAVVLLYILVRKCFSVTVAKVAVILWLMSPFNIIFSALSLPVIAVNASIMAVMLLVYLLMEKLEQTRAMIGWSVAVGVMLAVTNSLRPIMPIWIIALVLAYVLRLVGGLGGLRSKIVMPKAGVRREAEVALIKTQRRPLAVLARNMLVSWGVVMVAYIGVNALYLQWTSMMTGLPPTRNSGGWSIYVGANYNTTGCWSMEGDYLAKIKWQEPNMTEVHKRLAREGLERWSSLTLGEASQLLMGKSVVLMGGQAKSVYDLGSYPALWKREKVRNIVQWGCEIYTVVVVLLALKFFVNKYKVGGGKVDFACYLALVLVGLFLASLLVEVSTRYFMPFWVILVMVGAVGLVEAVKRYLGVCTDYRGVEP